MVIVSPWGSVLASRNDCLLPYISFNPSRQLARPTPPPSQRHPERACNIAAYENIQRPDYHIAGPGRTIQRSQYQGDKNADGADNREVNHVHGGWLFPNQHTKVEGKRPTAPAGELQGPEQVTFVFQYLLYSYRTIITSVPPRQRHFNPDMTRFIALAASTGDF
jgi:hypothetical protein